MASTGFNYNRSPWLGLTPYGEADAQLFYGRSVEIKELTAAIVDFPQTVIYGPSGTGKTSILRAGVFPALKERNFLPIYIRFDHAMDAPGYGEQLLIKLKAGLAAGSIDIVELAPKADPDTPENLWEFLHRTECWSLQNQLVRPVFVIDQFEEVFTAAAHKERIAGFTTELGDLCNNTIPDDLNHYLLQSGKRLGYPTETQNYRVVISLREDFLARLEELTTTIPVLKRNRYSLQALNGEEAMEVVLGPGAGLVDEQVARIIIRKAASMDSDPSGASLKNLQVEPALLSLLCSELDNRRIEQGMDRITADLVEASGSDIIKHFYDEAMGSVSKKTCFYIEDNLLTASGYRNSVAMDDVVSHGIPESEIAILIDKRLLRFEELMGIKRVEFTHDILTFIAKEQRDNRRYEQKLENDRRQLEALNAEKAKQRKKLRRYIWASAILLVLLLGVCITGYFLFLHHYELKYAHVVKRWGFFEGRDPVSDEEASHMHLYYKLTRNGWYTMSLKKKHFDKLYAMNGNGELTTDNSMASYLYQGDDGDTAVDSDTREKFQSVCQWTTVANEEGRPVYEMGYDKDTVMIWGFVYAPQGRESDKTQSAAYSRKAATDSKDNANSAANAVRSTAVVGHFIDNTGLLMKIRKEEADYVRIVYDRNGYDSLLEFYDQFGLPAPGPGGAYASRKVYDNSPVGGRGFPVEIASLDQFGDPMVDRDGNTGMKMSYNDSDNVIQAASFGPHHEAMLLASGYAVRKYKYDRYYNKTECRYFDTTGRIPVLRSSYIHGYQRSYDRWGKDTLLLNLDTTGQLITYSSDYPDRIPIETRQYDEDGNLTRLAYYALKNGQRSPILDSDTLFHLFTARYDKRFKKALEKCWYDKDLRPITRDYAKLSSVYDDNGNDTLTTYVYVDNKGVERKSIYKRKYTDGYQTQQLHVDGNMQPVTDSTGVCGWRTVRNVDALTDTTVSLDSLYAPARTVTYAYVVKKYADRTFARIESQYYLDADRRLVSSDGVRQRWAFDSYGNECDEWQYGVEDGKIAGHFYSHLRGSYGINHKLAVYETFNENDEPDFASPQVYHRKVMHYTADGHPANKYYSEKGELIDAYPYPRIPPVIAVLEDSGETALANRSGIYENDILIGWNNWRYDSTRTGKDNMRLLQQEMNLTQNMPKEVMVCRLYAGRPDHLKKITLPPGSPGFSYDLKYMTEKEFNSFLTYMATQNIPLTNALR